MGNTEKSTTYKKYTATCPYCQCKIDLYSYFAGFNKKIHRYEDFFSDFLKTFTIKSDGIVHIQCFKDYHMNREKKHLQVTEEILDHYIQDQKASVVNKLKKMTPTIRYRLVHYLDQKYGFTLHDPSTYSRLGLTINKINNGTHHKFNSISFSDEELLNFFVVTQGQLEEARKMYHKPFMDISDNQYNPLSCLNYDLAILGSHAFTYKKEIEKTLIQEAKKENETKQIKINTFIDNQNKTFQSKTTKKKRSIGMSLLEELDGA